MVAPGKGARLSGNGELVRHLIPLRRSGHRDYDIPSFIRLWRRLASLLKGGQTRRVGYSNTESSGSWSSLGRRLALARRAERRRPEVDRVRRHERSEERRVGKECR